MPEFKNPNQTGGQDSRGLLLMVAVFFVAMIGIRWFAAKNAPVPASTSANTAAQTTALPSATLGAPASSTIASSANTTATPTVQAASETSTVVENELYRITFSNRGGQVTSWVLKNFKTIGGAPLDMVNLAGSQAAGFPLSLRTYDPALTAGLANALYVVSVEGAAPSANGTLEAPATLHFDYTFGNVTVHKTFTFGADYVIHADAVVLQNNAPVRALLAWPAGFGDQETTASYLNAAVDTSANGKDDHISLKNVVGGGTLNGPWDFAGTSDQYFAAIFMPDQPADATLVTTHTTLMTEFSGSSATPIPRDQVFTAAPADNKPPHGSVILPYVGAAVGSLSGHSALRLFVGPKSIKVLQSVHTANGSNLGPVLDFGFWGPISKILFAGIQFVHAHIASNWGWAIIIFTILINIVVLPLRVQGMKSAMKMQRLQPQIDAIKAKFGNPGPTSPKMAEANAEIMALQKANGVSMFGGCIPSLIQFPLLIAFFYMMTRVVELRQAHWGWLHDLSQPDPYHILPILMVVTSFLAQYYTPSPGVDPQQQKMMAFMMPAVSGFMTWQYASGLALYWNVGNFIMILQQQIMNRTSLGREMRELAAKRAKARTINAKPSPRTIQGRK